MKGGIFVQILEGLAIGLAIGLLTAWVIAPVQYKDTSPASLRSEFKDQYREAIASAFNATRNLERAKARLSLLADPNSEQALISQAERMIAEGNSPDSAFEIAVLVNALKAEPQVSANPTGNAPPLTETSAQELNPTATQTPLGPASSTPQSTSSPGPSPTPRATATFRPTLIATPTEGAPFTVLTRDEVCDPKFGPGMLMVEVRNKKRQPIPGMELVISWSGGEEKFFTGLKPEISDGYADFQMQADTTYNLHLALGGETATGLSAPLCTDPDGNKYARGVRLVFQQP